MSGAYRNDPCAVLSRDGGGNSLRTISGSIKTQSITRYVLSPGDALEHSCHLAESSSATDVAQGVHGAQRGLEMVRDRVCRPSDETPRCSSSKFCRVHQHRVPPLGRQAWA